MDKEIIKRVTSVNMSCDWHADDPVVTEQPSRRPGRALLTDILNAARNEYLRAKTSR